MKHATANIQGKRRQKGPRGPVRRQTTDYRVTGTWNSRPGKPAEHHTTDRRAARRIARAWADQGAYVIVEEHERFGTYRTVQEIDGPAIVAQREAEQRAAEEAEAARIAAALATKAAARREALAAARTRAQAAALMVQPPVPRSPQQRYARHTAGQR